MSSQLPGSQPVQDLSPGESQFLKRLKEDWASLEAMKKLVNGGCDPAIIYWLLSAYWIGLEIKALEEHRKATRSLKETFERLDKHLSAACEEIAKMRELPEFSEVLKALLPIEECRDAVKTVIPELVEAADKRGSLRRELWLTAALLYVEKHLKQPCFPQVTQILDCIAVAEGEKWELSPDSIRKIYDRYCQRGQANVLLAETALRSWLADISLIGAHIRHLCDETGRQEA